MKYEEKERKLRIVFPPKNAICRFISFLPRRQSAHTKYPSCRHTLSDFGIRSHGNAAFL